MLVGMVYSQESGSPGSSWLGVSAEDPGIEEWGQVCLRAPSAILMPPPQIEAAAGGGMLWRAEPSIQTSLCPVLCWAHAVHGWLSVRALGLAVQL